MRFIQIVCYGTARLRGARSRRSLGIKARPVFLLLLDISVVFWLVVWLQCSVKVVVGENATIVELVGGTTTLLCHSFKFHDHDSLIK